MIYNLFPKFYVRHEGFSFYGPKADPDLIHNFCWPYLQSFVIQCSECFRGQEKKCFDQKVELCSLLSRRDNFFLRPTLECSSLVHNSDYTDAHLEKADTSEAMTHYEHDSSHAKPMEFHKESNSLVLPNVGIFRNRA